MIKYNFFKNRPKTLSVMLVLLAFALSQIGTRGSLLFSGLVILYVAWVTGSVFIKTAFSPSIIGLCLIAFFGALFAIIFGQHDFSWWQVFRSQIWFFVSIILLISTYKYAKRLSDQQCAMIWAVSSAFLVIVASLGLIELVTGLAVSPYFIKTVSEDGDWPRLYLVGVELVAPFLPIFILRRNLLGVFGAAVTLGLTGGKVAPIIGIFALMFLIFNDNKLVVKTPLPLIAFFLMILSVLSIPIAARIGSFVDSGDFRRSAQITDGLSVFTQDVRTMLIGNGIGTTYSEGYDVSLSSADVIEDKAALLENSKYDIENGYIFLLVRLGVIGTILYFISIAKKLGPYSLYFWLITLIGFAGGSPTGPGAALAAAAFGFAASQYSRMLISYVAKEKN